MFILFSDLLPYIISGLCIDSPISKFPESAVLFLLFVSFKKWRDQDDFWGHYFYKTLNLDLHYG